MDALGLEFLGPQYPAGRKADPVQGASDSLNVITYHTRRQTPETAKIQLDYVLRLSQVHQCPGPE